MKRVTGFKQHGVGMVELMVSITIGLLVMAGVVQLYVTSIETQRSQEGLSRIQENIRFVSNRLNDEGSSSGFLGCVPRFDDESRVINLLAQDTGELPDGTPQAANFTSSISGSDGDGVNGTDQVFFRFALPRSIPLVGTFTSNTDTQIQLDNSINYQLAYNSLNRWDVAVLTNCNYAVVFLITNNPGNNGVVRLARGATVPAGFPNAGQSNQGTNISKIFYGEESATSGDIQARLYLAGAGGYSYSVGLSEAAQQVIANGGSAQCDADHPQYCSLFRNGQEVMDGIVDFQVEYGWVNGNLVSFGTAAEVASADGWKRVDRVKMDVKLSAIEVTGTNDGNASKRIQREMSQVVMLKNPVVEL
ncbi:MAG: prepilin-type N-terminal cleavage/methylation domain-containing protein [Cellvibrionaceae bacterium]|nr:prepilin-type N-terminal cleavage/methylation domain-containing protein [Cellvibrionaceae bacterium]